MARILSDWIDNFLNYTDSTEPAESYRLWVAISTIASVLKRKCVLNWGTVRVHPNMFIILVGPPAARKGTAMGFGVDFLFNAEIDLSADSTTKEALIKAIKESYRNDIDEHGDMIHHCSYTICSPEFSVLIGHGDQQMLRYLTDWFDCGKGPEGVWSYDTKSMGKDRVTGIWVNLIGATTPEQIGMCPDIVGVGLASRIVFIYEETKGRIQPYPFLSEEQLALKDKLAKDLEEIQLLQGDFKPTDNWIEDWGPWYVESNQNPPFRDRRLSKYCERRPLHVLKLCMILSASRSNEMILRRADLKRAIKIIEMTESKMAYAFGAMGEDPRAKIMSALMREIMFDGTVTYTELLRRSYFDTTDERTFKAMLYTLESMSVIKIEKIEQTGADGGTEIETIITYIGEQG